MDGSKEKTTWFGRLKVGLQRSSQKLSEGIGDIFNKRKLDEASLTELEDLLIASDLGPETAARLVRDFAKNRFGKDIEEDEVKKALAEQVTKILEPYALTLPIDATQKPFVVLVVGVNGVGKTTTIGKLAKYYKAAGLKVMLAAGDTFRAAAVSQLKIWGERSDVEVISGDEGADSASLAFQACSKARQEGIDLLLIDTAGRLHNKTDLMQELAKIVRVLKKQDPVSPHATLLVLDATTGQNAHAQVETFATLTNITGLVLTKLDGSAKGGVLIALADRFKLPVYAIGVGEGADDLKPFHAEDFARSLMGLGG